MGEVAEFWQGVALWARRATAIRPATSCAVSAWVERLTHMGIRRAGSAGGHRCGAAPFVCRREALRSRAYDDMSLPLGLGQTISQPYTVAVMTQLLLGEEPLSQRRRVLEIGTGCGYQTAVLQALGLPEIYSIERLRPLHERAKQHLRAVKLLQQARLVR